MRITQSYTMFSTRLDWDLRPNRLSALLEGKRRADAAVLDLTESNPTRAGFHYPEEIAGDLRALTYAPSPAGAPAAREAVAAYYAGRGHTVTPERILLTASTSEAYAFLFKLLADPGDDVLVPRPSYPLFDYLAALESVEVKPYPLVYRGGWSIDLEALESAAGPRTRAVVAVNPNNPTGSFLKRAEVERLVAWSRARKLAIISDEVFSDYALSRDESRAETLVEVDEALVFCLSGLSKIAGLPQMKLAWIVTGGPAAVRAQAFERLELIADTYLSVGTPVQNAAAGLLRAGKEVRQQIARRLHDNLAFVLKHAAGSACEVLKVEGGWYAILRVPRTRSEEEWALELLREDDVLVQPGFFYDFDAEAYLVLSLLTPPESFRQGVRRIMKRVAL